MSTSGPRCPNHNVPLTRTNERNIGICPISGYRFSFEADDTGQESKIRYDTFGNAVKEEVYKLTPLDGAGG